MHLIDPTTDEHLKYETYVPGRLNSHVAAGGCSFCRPDTPMSPVQQRECERIFADEGLGMDVDDEGWDDDAPQAGLAGGVEVDAQGLLRGLDGPAEAEEPVRSGENAMLADDEAVVMS